MSDYYYYLAILFGVLIGWLTKIPFFIKWYKEREKNELELLELSKRILEMMKNGEL